MMKGLTNVQKIKRQHYSIIFCKHFSKIVSIKVVVHVIIPVHACSLLLVCFVPHPLHDRCLVYIITESIAAFCHYFQIPVENGMVFWFALWSMTILISFTQLIALYCPK